MGYEIGQRVRLPVTVTDVEGVATDATMAVQVWRDDGTAYAGLTVTNDPDDVGSYWTDVTVDSAGTHTYAFTASGAVTAVYRGQFYVRATGPRLLSLVEGKKHLGKRLDDDTDDEEILDWIDAITVVIENRVGAVVPTTYVETFTGTTNKLFLARKPVLAVTQVREVWAETDIRILTAEASGGPYTDNQYTVDVDTGVVTRRGTGYDAWFAPAVEVTYSAGRRPIPANIRAAGNELLAHHWRASQIATGSTRPRADVPTDVSALGIAIPNRVLVLLGARKAPRLGR